ncbi:hypothetical protein [Pelagibacterium sp.]|uniref:hypothetical protein n=1 Tax=Pelagibacterium sp. TaxID=1967288 RepID=UPI000C35BE80|nr:hypothetical protein [Pelagibacterium sp.]|tara:strand:- start:10840 stop:11151 length:312 start_codon:yes stop_codon:yes gene_type:complete
MSDWFQHLAALKPATVVPALFGAGLAVLIELKRHTWATATFALISGALVAFAATEPVIEFLNLTDNAAYAVAGVLGISGRNLIVWLLMVSKDPLSAWRNMGKK